MNSKVEKQEPKFFCNKCGYCGPSTEHNRPGTDLECAYFAYTIAPKITPPQPCPECEKLKAEGMVLVTKEDAESYCRILTLLGMEEEGSPIEEVERLLSLRDGMVCADCQDTGWLENREEGKYPCTCMTEAEPYQLLKAECDELAAQVEKMRATLEAVSMSSLTHQRIRAYIEKALALPDLSTGILNSVRRLALREAVDLVIDLGDDSSTLDARTLTAAAKAIADHALAADMEAGK